MNKLGYGERLDFTGQGKHIVLMKVNATVGNTNENVFYLGPVHTWSGAVLWE